MHKLLLVTPSGVAVWRDVMDADVHLISERFGAKPVPVPFDEVPVEAGIYGAPLPAEYQIRPGNWIRVEGPEGESREYIYRGGPRFVSEWTCNGGSVHLISGELTFPELERRPAGTRVRVKRPTGHEGTPRVAAFTGSHWLVSSPSGGMVKLTSDDMRNNYQILEVLDG